MKILLVTQYFHPENLPINYIASLLSRDKVDLDILTGKPNYPDGVYMEPHSFFSKIIEKNKKFTIYRFPLIPRGKKNKRLGLIINYLSFVFFGILLAPLFFLRKKYDFIFIYGISPITKAIPAIFIGKILKIPVILWVQDLWPDSVVNSGVKLPKSFINIIFIITNYIYKRVNLIATQSEEFKYKIINDFKIKEEKIIFLPNTIDEIFLKKNSSFELPKKLNNPESFKILFTGNIGRHQGIEDLIAAGQLIEEKYVDEKKIEFLFVGKGSMMKYYKKTVETKNIKNIHFLGSFPLEAMPAFIEKADALLISLKGDDNYNLTIPNKLQSYLASAKPIIGNIGGVSKKIIIDAKSGYVSEPGNIKELTELIKKMSRMSTKDLNTFGKNGEIYYKENFSNEVFLRNFHSMADKILNN